MRGIASSSTKWNLFGVKLLEMMQSASSNHKVTILDKFEFFYGSGTNNIIIITSKLMEEDYVLMLATRSFPEVIDGMCVVLLILFVDE